MPMCVKCTSSALAKADEDDKKAKGLDKISSEWGGGVVMALD